VALPQTSDKLFLPRDHASKHLWFETSYIFARFPKTKIAEDVTKKPSFGQQIART
jgi:hypothetical protein